MTRSDHRTVDVFGHGPTRVVGLTRLARNVKPGDVLPLAGCYFRVTGVQETERAFRTGERRWRIALSFPGWEDTELGRPWRAPDGVIVWRDDTAEVLRPVPGWERVPFRWQYCTAEGNETDDRREAVEVRAWSGVHGDSVIAALRLTPRGRWKFAESDGVLMKSWYRRSFFAPELGLRFLGERWRQIYVPAVCRCGTGGECD